MSDDWIRLVPDDPRYVPERDLRARAKARFAEIAPAAEIDVEVSDAVAFFDCGTNFARVRCPSCVAVIPVEWWQAWMDADYDGGFRLASQALPCCGARHTLNDLIYEWPQAFGRFVIEAMNPNIGALKEEHKREVEGILGTKLRVVYRHI